MKSRLVALRSSGLGSRRPLTRSLRCRSASAIPARATYSELHEALRDGHARRLIRSRPSSASGRPALLWRRLHAAINGTGDWNSGLIALTQLAELRSRAYADSAARLKRGSRPPRESRFPRTRVSRPTTSSRRCRPSSRAEARRVGRFRRAGRHPLPHPDPQVRPRRCLGARPPRRRRRGFGVRPVSLGARPGVQGPLSHVALLLHRSRAHPSHVARVCRARQLRHSAAHGHPRLRRAALDRDPGESAGAARCARARARARGLRRQEPRSRRIRFPGQRQLVGDLADGKVAHGVGARSSAQQQRVGASP